ncbi:MAG: metalloregulator ArsR/SmtB family transcription factor [Candidatus Acidiferrum sp.]
MVNNPKAVNAIFAALADPTRRAILVRLGERGECPVTILSKPFPISPPAISRHLRVLERARLIERRRTGRVHLIRARSAALKQAQSWLAHCAAAWDFQFDALDEFLHHEKPAQKRKEKRK